MPGSGWMMSVYSADTGNCERICGISLSDHVPNVDILNRCNTSSVESQQKTQVARSFFQDA